MVPAAGTVPSDETAREILGWCREQLSRYKCPRSLDFVTSLPRNELGKLVKRKIAPELRERSGKS